MTTMHTTLAQFLAAQQQAPAERPLTDDEQSLLDYIALLDGQMIVFERLSASLDTDHAATVRDNLTDAEIGVFTQRWSDSILDVCLQAGVTASELRNALRTGVLPDNGIVLALAELRQRSSAVATDLPGDATAPATG